MITTIVVVTGLYAFIVGFILFFSFSLSIRRWHDLGHSGWMSLLGLVPIVGVFVLLYLLFAKGDEGANAYGEPNIDQPFWKSFWGKTAGPPVQPPQA